MKFSGCHPEPTPGRGVFWSVFPKSCPDLSTGRHPPCPLDPPRKRHAISAISRTAFLLPLKALSRRRSRSQRTSSRDTTFAHSAYSRVPVTAKSRSGEPTSGPSASPGRGRIHTPAEVRPESSSGFSRRSSRNSRVNPLSWLGGVQTPGRHRASRTRLPLRRGVHRPRNRRARHQGGHQGLLPDHSPTEGQGDDTGIQKAADRGIHAPLW